MYSIGQTIIIILHAVHGLPKWQDRCYRASRELCSNYVLKFVLGLFCAVLYFRCRMKIVMVLFLHEISFLLM